MSHRQRAVMFVVMLAVTLGLDQGTKVWARTLPMAPAHCELPADFLAHRCAGIATPVIDGIWDWQLAFNPGAAFTSFVGNGSRVALSALAAIAVIVVFGLAWRTRPDQRLRRVALAMVAGGALGNLIDRVREGAVTDFIGWKWHDHHWPLFNVADAALLVGVVLLAIDQLRARWVRPA